MPTKVAFRVIHCTGADDNFPAQQLEVHSPLCKGWQTSRFCPYPQELTIRLERNAIRVRKLQLLSHQYLITRRVGLFVGVVPPGVEPTLENAQFRHLGFISLSNNEASNFKARELKSVLVDVVCTYIKFVFHQNHINHQNIFNQVGVVAINVIGDPVDHFFSKDGPDDGVQGRGALNPPSQTSNFAQTLSVADVVRSYLPVGIPGQATVSDPFLWGSVNRPERISIMDDLTFAVYQDPKTADLIRTLEEKKSKAIVDEQYDVAKRLKQAIAELRKLGERLGRLEAEKQRAVEEEDFDTAKAKKLQKDELAVHVLEQLHLHHLVSVDDAYAGLPTDGGRHDSPHLPPLDHHLHYNAVESGHSFRHAIATSPPKHVSATHGQPSSMPLQSLHHEQPTSPYIRPEADNQQSSSLLDSRDSSVTHSSSAPVDVASPFQIEPVNLPPSASADQVPGTSAAQPAQVHREDDGDRPLPALVKSSVQMNIDGDAGDNTETTLPPQALDEKTLQSVNVAVDVFGLEAVTSALSKNYQHRSSGLAQCSRYLSSRDCLQLSASSSVTRACTQLLQRVVKDRVFSVFQEATAILFAAVETIEGSRSDVSNLLSKTLPVLLSRLGDMNPRIKETSSQTIMQLANSPVIRPLQVVALSSVDPFKKQKPTWQLFKGRLEMVNALLKEQQLTSGLTVDGIMRFVKPAFDHGHGSVRDAAIRLVIDLYRLSKREVRQHLPPDDAASRKKPALKAIFTGFDQVDGKLSEKERKAQARAAENAQQEEVRALRQQLEMLRTVQADVAAGRNPTDPALLEQLARNMSGAANAGTVPTIAVEDTSGGHPQQSRTKPKGNSRAPQQQKARQSVSPKRSNEQPATVGHEQDQRVCIFCDRYDDSFDEQGLDTHYFNSCPLLTRCKHCSQAVEVASLSDHLVRECSGRQRSSMRQCDRCRQAVFVEEYEKHRKLPSCKKLAENSSLCPLCSQQITSSNREEEWKRHLLNVCPQNPRRRPQGGLQAPGGLRAAPAGRQARHTPTGARSTSRIPTLDANRSTSRIPLPQNRSPRR